MVTLALKRNRARVRYAVWLAASAKFMVPLALLVAVGSSVSWRTAPGVPMPVVLEEIGQPFPITEAPEINHEVKPRVDWTPELLLLVWAAGFVAIGARWGRRWARMNTDARRARAIEMGLPVPVRVSAMLREPGVFGVFRPVLLLPEGITEKLTPAQLEAILAHEMCHVRRRDNLATALHMVVEAVFWFHPLVWWIGSRLVEERERACDEEVLRAGRDPQTYAEGILKVCELYLKSPLDFVAGVAGGNLNRRIEEIMTNQVRPGLSAAAKCLLAGAGALAVMGPIAVGLMNAPPMRAQSVRPIPPASPKWEVISIRPTTDCLAGRSREADGGGKGRAGGAGLDQASPGRLSACGPLAALITNAYVALRTGAPNPHPLSASIEGGPGWVKSDRYQITAKAEGTPNQYVMGGPMMQALLEDRFKLKIHRESREVPVYALTVAKGGPKLQPFREGSCVHRSFESRSAAGVPAAPLAPGQALCRFPFPQRKGQNVVLEAQGMSLNEFAVWLGLDRPVVDQTGLEGLFDLHVEFAPDENTPGFLPGGIFVAALGPQADTPSEPPGGPSIFAAVLEQLGLKLERSKSSNHGAPFEGPGDVLVIDQVERPTEN